MPRTNGSSGSFCRVFQHGGSWYAYDVNTNELIQVDPVLADVLPLWGPLSEDEVVGRLAGAYGAEAVRAAIGEIQQARSREGLFLPDRPRSHHRCESCHDRSAYQSRLTHLTLSVSEQCNLRCHYCLHSSTNTWIRPYRDQGMSLATAQAALAFFAAHSGDTAEPAVSFYGGEPLLELGLIKAVVAEAHAHDDWPRFRFIIDTNGTLLDDEAADFIATAGIHLQISLDGPAPLNDLHRITREGRGSHAAIMDGLRRLLRRDPGAAERISFVVTLAPPYDLLAVADYFGRFPLFQELGIKSRPRVRLNFADLEGIAPSAVAVNGHEHIDPRTGIEQARSQYITACAEGRRHELSPVLTGFFDQGIISFYHRRRGRMPATLSLQGCCLPGQRRLHVRADGALQTCERVGESLVIGHVDSGIDQAAVDGLFSSMSRALGSKCSDCWAVRLCDVCFTVLAPSWGQPGADTAQITEAVCSQIRRSKEETLALYLALREKGPQSLAFLKQTSVS